MADQKLTDKSSISSIDDSDLIHVVDVSDTSSSAEGTSKKGLFSLFKSTLKTYFDTLYSKFEQPSTTKTTPVDADTFTLWDSAASFAAKKLNFANLKATLKTYFDSVYFDKTTETSDDITEGSVNLFLTSSERSDIAANNAKLTANTTNVIAALNGATLTGGFDANNNDIINVGEISVNGEGKIIGDVIIGSASTPNVSLDVRGNLQIGNTGLTGNTSWPLFISDGSNLGWKVSDGLGNSKFEFYAGWGGINEIRFLNSVKLIGFNQNLKIGTNSSYNVIIKENTGNVGIGDTSPSEKLSVTGNALVSGSITANSFVKDGATSDDILLGDGTLKKYESEKERNLGNLQLKFNDFSNNNAEEDIDISTQKNLFLNSELYTTANNVVVGSGMTIDTSDVISYKGVDLVRAIGTNYYSNITLRQSIFTIGKRYMVSFYVKSNTGEDYFWHNLNNTSSSGHGARLVDENVRRVYYIGEATSTSNLDMIDVPTTEIGTGSGSFPYIGVFKTSATPLPDFYFGGIQIEEIPDNYVDGIIWIGDSTIQANSSTNNYYLSTSVSKYLEAILNVNSFNKAVGGERLDQMDARWATDITPLKENSKYVIIQGGLNDISQGRTLVQMQSSLSSMASKAATDGLIPVFLTCSPSVNFDSSDNTLRDTYNQWLKDNYKLVIDVNEILENDDNLVVGFPIEDHESDGVHYGEELRKSLAIYIAKTGFLDFLQPSDYQKTTTTYTGSSIKANNITATGDITANSFVKDGATSDDILLGDGTTATYDEVGVLKRASTSLTSTQIKNLNTTKIEAIAAPGTKKMIVVHQMTVKLIYGTSTYGGSSAELQLVDSASNKQLGVTILDATDDKIMFSFAGKDIISTENSAIDLYVPSGNPITGDSSVEIDITYEIIDL